MNQPVPKGDTGFVILITMTAALGGLLFGFDTSIINGAVGALQNSFNANSW
jgi:SP family sugar:H+ symporter-like MFS transporter